MFVSILLIGVGLSMDAFAVSVTNGLTLKPFRLRHGLWMGLYFGGFQFLMPLLGWLLGGTVSRYVMRFGPYISFALLAFIGGKMLMESIRPAEEEDGGMAELRHRSLLAAAVATSIDALAVGVSFAFQPELRLLPSCLLIGCTTFVISFLGAVLGSAIPWLSGKRAGILGGLVLIGIGVKLLVEGVILK